MAMTGENKDIKIPGSLGYHSLETLDRGCHLPQQDQLIQQQSQRSSNPERFSGAGVISTGATSAPISGRSESKTPSRAPSKYRECLKNHAASTGGKVTDGCGEFMPGGVEGTLEALKCDACNCHRNFHRKVINNDAVLVHPLQLTPPLPPPSVNHHRTISLGTQSNHWTSIVQPVKMAFGFGGGSVATDSSSEQEFNFNPFQPNSVAPPPPPSSVTAKKRFRTKFTREQKDKMLEFAEKVGWRIPKEDDPAVQRFCAEFGLKRQVLKVWMHNNKNSVKKQPQEPLESNAAE
ncbi:unnamed protein product [Ilex paraguariensis]|uniref:ZF-HD dimerization-type domain-containing protein n=1 Tax=Ilex paraguariensis TaxID=185542 RepID=A0ABC8U8D5_9AQUA